MRRSAQKDRMILRAALSLWHTPRESKICLHTEMVTSNVAPPLSTQPSRLATNWLEASDGRELPTLLKTSLIQPSNASDMIAPSL